MPLGRLLKSDDIEVREVVFNSLPEGFESR